MDPVTLFSIIKGGIVLGALYALMATGLSLVWTTLGIFNFAHGAFIALGVVVANFVPNLAPLIFFSLFFSYRVPF